MDVSILSVAEYVLSKTDGKRQNKAQLNTICYLIQKSYIQETEEPLFKDQFLKKGRYPECAILNGAFSDAGNKPYLEAKDLKEFHRKFSAKTREIMDNVLEENKNITSKDIISKMNTDEPWMNTPEGKVVTNKKMSRTSID